MAEDPLEQTDVNTLLIFKKIFGIVSIILLIFIVLLFWFSKKIKRKITNNSILYLTMIEIGYLISVLLPYYINNPDSNLCFIETLLINFFNHGRIVWCFLMTYLCIMESMNKILFENHLLLFSILFLFILLLISFLSSLFLFLNKLSGNYGAYCFLPLNNEEMRYYVIKIHIYYTAIKFCFIIITLYNIIQSRKNKKIFKKVGNYKSNHKYLIYPKIICFLQTLDLGTNIYKIILINSSTFWIELLHIFLNCSEGSFVFIIFVRSSLFQTLFSRFYKNFKKKKRNKKKNRNTLNSINSFINNKNATPLIDGDANNEDN
jgi:hypothetical protein